MFNLAVKFTVDESYAASISGGPLGSSYTLNQFHLHWGSQQDQGSEHTVDGHRFEKKHTLAGTLLTALYIISAMMENYIWSTINQHMTTFLLPSQTIRQILWLLLEFF